MHFEASLIEACSQGDRKAQEELYKKCFAPLLSICFRFTTNKDDAVILLNESFYKILKNVSKQDGNSPFFAWAKRITLNHCIDHYKKENTRKKHLYHVENPELEMTALTSSDTDEDEDDLSPEILEKVKEEILNLPATTQEVFQLFVLEGHSHKEIANLLNMKEGTSKWHVNNARTILKKLIKKSVGIISSIAI